MSQVQPITIDEQDHYLATRQVTRGVTHAPKRHKVLKASKPAVERAPATFGKPDNLPGFKFPIGSTVHTTNGSTAWTVVAQAETPAGTSPRSYRAVAGKMERIFGENALRSAKDKKLIVIDVRLNKATGQIEPVNPAVKARQELKSMLVASIAPTLAPTIDDPALHTVEPMACRFTQTTGWKMHGISSLDHRTRREAIAKARYASREDQPPKLRANAPFAPTAIVTVLVANPKKPGSKSHERFALYQSGKTVADQMKAGVLMVDVKWDAAHGFITVS